MWTRPELLFHIFLKLKFWSLTIKVFKNESFTFPSHLKSVVESYCSTTKFVSLEWENQWIDWILHQKHFLNCYHTCQIIIKRTEKSQQDHLHQVLKQYTGISGGLSLPTFQQSCHIKNPLFCTIFKIYYGFELFSNMSNERF